MIVQHYSGLAHLVACSGFSSLALVQHEPEQTWQRSTDRWLGFRQAVRAEEIYKLLQNRFSTWEEEQARRGAAAAYRGW